MSDKKRASHFQEYAKRFAEVFDRDLPSINSVEFSQDKKNYTIFAQITHNVPNKELLNTTEDDLHYLYQYGIAPKMKPAFCGYLGLVKYRYKYEIKHLALNGDVLSNVAFDKAYCQTDYPKLPEDFNLAPYFAYWFTHFFSSSDDYPEEIASDFMFKDIQSEAKNENSIRYQVTDDEELAIIAGGKRVVLQEYLLESLCEPAMANFKIAYNFEVVDSEDRLIEAWRLDYKACEF